MLVHKSGQDSDRLFQASQPGGLDIAIKALRRYSRAGGATVDNLWCHRTGRGWIRIAVGTPITERPPRVCGRIAELHEGWLTLEQRRDGVTGARAQMWLPCPDEAQAIPRASRNAGSE